jgi:hypothetical protein
MYGNIERRFRVFGLVGDDSTRRDWGRGERVED